MELGPEGSVYLKECRALVVADLHLGKAAAFRAGGLPVPEGDVERDLHRLELICGQYAEVDEVVVAGDLFHSQAGLTEDIAEQLRGSIQRLRRPVSLVLGNHDRKVKSLPDGLRVVDALERDGVRIIHDPADADGTGLVIAGHWHPVVKLRAGGRSALRLPCFLLRGNLLILPSFGSFTGGRIMDLEPGDRCFVAMRDEVVELPSGLIRPR